MRQQAEEALEQARKELEQLRAQQERQSLSPGGILKAFQV